MPRSVTAVTTRRGRTPTGTHSPSVLTTVSRVEAFHKASVKHLKRYVDECVFRLNEGNVRIHTRDRLATFAKLAFRRRLTWEQFTEG